MKLKGHHIILLLIMVGMLAGGILTTLGEKGKPVIKFFEGVNAAVLKLVYLVMLFAPVGVFALVATKLGAAVVDRLEVSRRATRDEVEEY